MCDCFAREPLQLLGQRTHSQRSIELSLGLYPPEQGSESHLRFFLELYHGPGVCSLQLPKQCVKDGKKIPALTKSPATLLVDSRALF